MHADARCGAHLFLRKAAGAVMGGADLPKNAQGDCSSAASRATRCK